MGGTAAHGNAPPQPPSASVVTLRPTTPDPDKSVNLLSLRFSFGEFPALAPSGRNLVPGTLYAKLPAAEAFRRAAGVHPGLRAPPPEGGVLRECLRRHGVVGTWADLPALVPDLAPDATAAAAAKDAEQASLGALKAEFAHAPYRVAGRRGRPGVALWDPARLADPAAALTRLLGAEVAVEARPEPPPTTADPPPTSVAIDLARYRPGLPLPRPTRPRCANPVPTGRQLRVLSGWLAGTRVDLGEVGWRTIARPELSTAA